MYNYYPHPSNLRQSSGCVALLIGEGYAGYGLYLAILEVLRDAPNYRYNPDPSVWHYVLNGSDKCQVERVLRNYGLFDLDDDGLLYSPWLCSQLQEYTNHKSKLSDAGRRGAAKRWAAASKEDGQAIATPSKEDGQAIAYNNTQPNITQSNLTIPIRTDGIGWRDLLSLGTHPISEQGYTDAVASGKYQGIHGYLLQECYRRQLSWESLEYIADAIKSPDAADPVYRAFVALCRHVDRDKYQVKLPDNYYLSQLFG